MPPASCFFWVSSSCVRRRVELEKKVSRMAVSEEEQEKIRRELEEKAKEEEREMERERRRKISPSDFSCVKIIGRGAFGEVRVCMCVRVLWRVSLRVCVLFVYLFSCSCSCSCVRVFLCVLVLVCACLLLLLSLFCSLTLVFPNPPPPIVHFLSSPLVARCAWCGERRRARSSL